MFQNITESVEEQESIKVSKTDLILKELLKVQNIIVFVLTLLVSTLSIEEEIAPFGLAMVAATLSSGIPVFGVLIAATIGTLAGNGVSAFLNFVLSSIIYFALVLIFKPKVAVEERNELLKTGKRLFVACFLVSFFQNIRGIVLTYDVFMALVSAALTYVFYKIFVNGLAVIKDWKIKKAFTLEELIASSIIVAIASMVLNGVTIFNLHLSNIIIIFLVMLLGWKNGMLVGCTTGLSMGLVISMIELQNGLQIAVFAVAGILAGALNRFGKIGVIVGFMLGNSLLIYLTNGDTIKIVYFREIFIAAIGLLFVPNHIKIEIEDLVGKNKLLSDLGENRLAQNEEMIHKLNIISDTISEMVVDKQEEIADMDEDFKDILFGNLEEISNNMFCEDIIQEDNHLADDIYAALQKNDILLESDFIEILKNHNNYIVMQDSTIKNDLQEVIKIINRSYKMLQIEITKRQEKKKNLKTMKKGFEDISNAIRNSVKTSEKGAKTSFKAKEKELLVLLKSKYESTISIQIQQAKNQKYLVQIAFANTKLKDKQYIANISNILTKSLGAKIAFVQDEKGENYVQTYMSEDKYNLKIGSSKVTKEGNAVSGDCNLQMKLKDGKYLLAISDGMGSGRKARQSSKLAIKMLEDMLVNGFDDDEVINFINDSVNFNTDSEMYSTMDFAILDLYTGTAKFAKSGACNTYIKNRKNVKVIQSHTMPVGMLEKAELDVQDVEVSDGDIIVMCSDGLLESQNNMNKDWIEEYIRNISTTNVQKVADLIVAEAIDNSFGIAKDDITVIIAKVMKKK